MPLLDQAGSKKELEIYSSFAQMLLFKKGKSFSVLFENIHTKPIFEKQILLKRRIENKFLYRTWL